MSERVIAASNLEAVANLFGAFDGNVKAVEKKYQVSVLNRDNEIRVSGAPDNVENASKVISQLLQLAEQGEPITEQNINYISSMVENEEEKSYTELTGDCVCVTVKGKPIKPKTFGQKQYTGMIADNTVTFGIGPAGTGKTYLAVAMAVSSFRKKEVSRIILTRPAVEAGESLGFLPGDLQTKVDPYLRPLYDALFEMLGAESFQAYQEKGMIEVAPLAYMRGRTLDDSFIILDEAQNTTKEQMKMFLTRIGFHSKVVITGDITQIDLPAGKKSGLKDAIRILKNIDDIGIQYLTDRDVVRHPLIQKIIRAYDRFDQEQQIKKHDRQEKR
ncbi:PhoH family protein [Acetivibrio sp. MSJd-27]|jgi:phosphate starvation-inducible protein phoH, predicted ATPase|uniref:PhoH family protein n=1 Tax=Acetivibrio sp. MSJd-27 TaxID=2841523 RepID=UPI0015AAA4CA|nr:PhoH family protein [Acetivibrio sp. MSJd-27]MBU5449407.1 PhoH family protein [Acetivibrio sp. MSJd-27]